MMQAFCLQMEGGLRPLQPPLFLKRTRPLQVSSCRELDVVFAPAVFLSSSGLLSRTSHHQEELRQAHACIILPASKDRTHQGV